MKKVAELKETSTLSMLSVDMENKENGSLDVKNSVENGRPPDPADWAVTDVVNYFRTAGFEEQANAFQEQVTVSWFSTDKSHNKDLKSMWNEFGVSCIEWTSIHITIIIITDID
ncbi:sterile alpha motif domain-containing protein 13 isoform X3 [Trachemys scripta elegans]|uniref:sterile alpha motif domain-containing protein 13 isoform X3 n=1 Tax=Trachemys scripta elegans TaxID=31138 RepID=UPI00155704EA|nr:sterile alpha motif domain-containing protein 13 isoform X3 [Trachemys scripta elegans]